DVAGLLRRSRLAVRRNGIGELEVPRTQRSAPSFTAWCAAEPGPISPHSLLPGSAERHEECRTASGTRGLAPGNDVHCFSNAWRSILPVPVFGSSSRNFISRGYL